MIQDSQKSLMSLRPGQLYFGTKHLKRIVGTLESAGFKRIRGKELVESNPDQFWDEPPSRVRGGVWNAVYRRSLFTEEDSRCWLDAKIDVNPYLGKINGGKQPLDMERARITFGLIEEDIGMVGKAIAELELEKSLGADISKLEAMITHYPFSTSVRLAFNQLPEYGEDGEARTARRNNRLMHDVIAIACEGELIVADFSLIEPERYVKEMIDTARDVHEGLISFKTASHKVKIAAYGNEAKGLERELAMLDPDDTEGLERLIERHGGMDAFLKNYEGMRTDAEKSWSEYMEEFAMLLDLSRPLLLKVRPMLQNAHLDTELTIAEIVVTLHMLDEHEAKELDALLEMLSWDLPGVIDYSYSTKRLKNDLINGYEAIRTMLAMNDTFQHIAGLIADRYVSLELAGSEGETGDAQDYMDDIRDAVPIDRRV